MLFSLISGLERLNIILASASPRRFELLQQIGLDFKVVLPDIEEKIEHQTGIENLVLQNAKEKALSVAQKYPESLVIGADTIVSINNQILGKPNFEEDAFKMLQSLSGKTHQVYTAIALALKKYDALKFDVVCTNVTFRSLNNDEIWAYINTGEPFDKAGAYGIQGQGALLVEKIDGCFYNVVGLPLTKFYLMLVEFLQHYVV